VGRGLVETVTSKFPEMLDAIDKYLKKGDFESCQNLSLDLVRLSAYFNYKDGIFVSEYILSIFNDLSKSERYSLEKDEVDAIAREIAGFFKSLKEALPLHEKNIWRIYNKMRDLRSFITIFVMEANRTRRRRPRLPFIEVGAE